MTETPLPYTIFPLGDSAFTIDFGNCIAENINIEVLCRFHEFKQKPLSGMVEAVPAYSSLTVYYDPGAVRKTAQEGQTAYDCIVNEAAIRLQQPALQQPGNERIIHIPVCYEKQFAPDLEKIAVQKSLSVHDVIAIHTSCLYKVFMIGFMPGFPYMGEVDERIAMPRKQQPVNVMAGSIGIAGRQTGIYPFMSPGGWHIIGCTPFKMFDASSEAATLLRAGDRIQFYSIGKEEFEEEKARN